MGIPGRCSDSTGGNAYGLTLGGSLADSPIYVTSAHYQELFAALINGDSGVNKRPPLPAELILQIFRLAGCSVPAPNLTIQISAVEDPLRVRSDGPLVQELWFYTPPLTKFLLQKLAGVKLVTESSHQGWVADGGPGSWSWWEIGVIRGSERIRDGTTESHVTITDKENVGLRWGWEEPTTPVDVNDRSHYPTLLHNRVSHRHDLYDHLRVYTYAFATPIDTCLTLEGRRFTFEVGQSVDHVDDSQDTIPDTACLGPLLEGDRLAVYACAQHRGWECVAKWAKLEFDVFWEP